MNSGGRDDAVPVRMRLGVLGDGEEFRERARVDAPESDGDRRRGHAGDVPGNGTEGFDVENDGLIQPEGLCDPYQGTTSGDVVDRAWLGFTWWRFEKGVDGDAPADMAPPFARPVPMYPPDVHDVGPPQCAPSMHGDLRSG